MNETSNQERDGKAHQAIPQRMWALGRAVLVRLLCVWVAIVAWEKIAWVRIDGRYRRF